VDFFCQQKKEIRKDFDFFCSQTEQKKEIRKDFDFFCSQTEQKK